jgi:hypothetical protein
MNYVEEVALAAAGFTSLEEPTAAADGDKKPAASAEPADDDDRMCVVCLVERKDHIFIPCGHLCACEGCAAAVNGQESPVCPMCRTACGSFIRVFA